MRAREPLMPAAPESGRSAAAILAEPLRDRNFSQLVRFLFVWSLTSNLAIPFFAVYMLSELGLSLPAVIGFTVLSQAANILFVRVWGPMADRVGSKPVLSLSASLYLLVILGWVFTAYPERHFLTLPLLGVLHVFRGSRRRGGGSHHEHADAEGGAGGEGDAVPGRRRDRGERRRGDRADRRRPDGRLFFRKVTGVGLHLDITKRSP